MDEFKKAVTDYALAQHFPHKWAASKTDWAVAVCQRNKACDFRARVNFNTALQLYEVTVFREGHVCAGLGDPKRAQHNCHPYLVELIGKHMTVDHSTKDAQIIAHLKQVHGISVPQSSANKARLAILGSRQEDQLAEFRQIEAWLSLVKIKDPAAHVLHEAEDGRFSCAFVCSGAARAAWPYCKPFFAVDGTWTKNKQGMILLLAAAMDADDNLVILAWALVQSETQVSWEWFLRALLQAFPSVGAHTTTVVSDRQKGLLNAIQTVLPSATEGYCCWHLAENIKKHYGMAARKQFWCLVYAETANKFKTAMSELAELSSGPAHYLRDSEDGGIPYKFWASYAFPGRRIDHVTSNLSEIFNSALRLHRELPPLQLLSAVYNYQMGHFHERVQKATAWKQILAPHLHGLFVAALQQARKLNCIPASANTGLVKDTDGKQFNVELSSDPQTRASICSCGVPQLMLIPCAHMCALASALKKPPVLYAHAYWTTRQWRLTYAKPYIVAELDDLDFNELDAPESSTRPKKGRPQKQRREAGKGGSSSRDIVPSLCNKCGEFNHSARHCRTAY